MWIDTSINYYKINIICAN